MSRGSGAHLSVLPPSLSLLSISLFLSPILVDPGGGGGDPRRGGSAPAERHEPEVREVRLALDLDGAYGPEPVDGVLRGCSVAVGDGEAAARAALGAKPGAAGGRGGAPVRVRGEEGEGMLPDLVRESVPRRQRGGGAAAHGGGGGRRIGLPGGGHGPGEERCGWRR